MFRSPPRPAHRRFIVNQEPQILVGRFQGFSWLRCIGKGSFQTSPQVKSFGDARIAAGETRLVIDLGGCTGMDSTFMGCLAGLSCRLSANDGHLEIADADARARQSLEDLGLDCLMRINPPDAPWTGRLETIRKDISAPRDATALPDMKARARHVLEAHETLSNANHSNAARFSGVVSLLRDELDTSGGRA